MSLCRTALQLTTTCGLRAWCIELAGVWQAEID
jgi:hypothetical protein